jgi:hypothetical protein
MSQNRKASQDATSRTVDAALEHFHGRQNVLPITSLNPGDILTVRTLDETYRFQIDRLNVISARAVDVSERPLWDSGDVIYLSGSSLGLDSRVVPGRVAVGYSLEITHTSRWDHRSEALRKKTTLVQSISVNDRQIMPPSVGFRS